MTPSSYEIIETISESLTTKVYKAWQPTLGRMVLLKMLHKNLVGNVELVKRFEREARACAMLRSEHIVQIYHLEEYDGAPAIVSEFVEGTALDELLAQQPNQSEEFALTIAHGVLKALVVAHGEGVVHRDIKPGNILVAREGTVKVTDFGLASVAMSPTLTMDGAVMGTPAYMSPEQSLGKQAKAGSDLFSLGTTLLEVLTGEKLFDGASYAECLNKITHFAPEMLDRFTGTMSPPTLSFLKRLMMPNEQDRFASAQEALQFIRRQKHSTTKLLAAQLAGRTRIAPRYLGLAVVLLVLGAILVVLNLPRVPDEPVPLVPSTRGSISPAAEKRINDSLKRGSSQKSRDTLVFRTDPTAVKIPGVPFSRGSGVQNADSLSGKTISTQSADSGYLQVSSNPWAKVYLGTEYIGTTPIAGTLKVSAGVHTLTFQNESYSPIVKRVTIRPNTQESVAADFFANAGFIFVSVVPWAEVHIDDQHRGTTPISQPLAVSPGTRKVRLHHPAFEDFTTSAVITPHDTVRIVHSFGKQTKK